MSTASGRAAAWAVLGVATARQEETAWGPRNLHQPTGRVTAVGGFQEAEVGWFDREKGGYRHIPVREQVEVLSLVGNVAARDGEPVLHVHAVLGRPDGSTLGGHLLSARVRPTLEVIVTEVAPELTERVDRRPDSRSSPAPGGSPVAGRPRPGRRPPRSPASTADGDQGGVETDGSGPARRNGAGPDRQTRPRVTPAGRLAGRKRLSRRRR